MRRWLVVALLGAADAFSVPTALTKRGRAAKASAAAESVLPVAARYGALTPRDRAAIWASGLGAATWAALSGDLVVRAVARAAAAGAAAYAFARLLVFELARAPPGADVTDLAVAGSTFRSLAGVDDAHVVDYASSRAGDVAVHASHGFGANCLSFCDVLPLVARRGDVGSATAHDHPGFGLTRRPVKLAAYELKGDMASACLAPAALGVFVGHSMGSISAAEAALARATAGRPTALVLIDAAIFHLRDPPPTDARYAASRRRRGLAAVGRGAARLLRTPLASWPFRVMIRRLVASRDFWPTGLGAAWHASRRADAAKLRRYAALYAIPAAARGWERGLLDFCTARFRQGLAADEPLARRLARALRDPAVPLDRVLLVHGAADPVVPCANSRRIRDYLAREAPAAAVDLVEVDDCGHCPHEEDAPLVAAAIGDLIERAKPRDRADEP